MFYKRLQCVIMVFLVVSVIGIGKERIAFTDDFEKGLSKWDIFNPARITLGDSGDPKHGKVMTLRSGGPGIYALIKGSDGWTNYRLEGDVCFPVDYIHYLGLIYNFNTGRDRADFGSISIVHHFFKDYEKYKRTGKKYIVMPTDGNSHKTILLVNPHRDSNASRALYPEYIVTTTDEDWGMKTGQWAHFTLEVVGPACHFYLGDMKTPKITFDYLEYSSGRVGLKPRFSGAEVWVDNISVNSIDEFAYKGPIQPAGITYTRDKMITDWDYIGPFSNNVNEIEMDGFNREKSYIVNNNEYRWQPFNADERGCTLTGKICNAYDNMMMVYFHREIISEKGGEATLEFFSSNRILFRLNGELVDSFNQKTNMWYDFLENPAHKGRSVKLNLKPGKNDLLILVMGGRYSGDGFYAAIKK